MNGFEFSKEALSITAYELDKIVAITDASEVDWLEFKAAIKAQNSEEDEKANDADFILHLLKALIGMANGIGGMVVLEPKTTERGNHGTPWRVSFEV